jgi:putative sterol carrier protein
LDYGVGIGSYRLPRCVGGGRRDAVTLHYGTREWETEYNAELARRMEEPPPYIHFTPEWVYLYEKAVQEDADYKEAAKNWEGTVVLHITPSPDHGLDYDIYILMDLWHGDCRSMRVVPTEVGEAGDYIISGALERWAMSRGDTNKAVMQGKLSLRGDVGNLVRAAKAAKRLTELSSGIGGNYPLLLTPEEIEGYRTSSNAFYRKFLDSEHRSAVA